MHCYKHPDREAVGICKQCQKGLCSDCAADLGHGLACKGEHEEAVEMLNTIIEKNSRIISSAPKNTLIAPIFYAFMGAIFTFYGYGSRQGMSGLPFVIGVGFLIFAAVVFLANRRIYRNKS